MKRYTALGFVISRKSTDWGWNLAYVATDNETLSICIKSPSSTHKFRIIWNSERKCKLQSNNLFICSKNLKLKIDKWMIKKPHKLGEKIKIIYSLLKIVIPTELQLPVSKLNWVQIKAEYYICDEFLIVSEKKKGKIKNSGNHQLLHDMYCWMEGH